MREGTEKDRRRLAIPPAYHSVKVATDSKAELVATAVDAAGRTHSYYSTRYTDRQQTAKWSRIVGIHRAIPALVEKLEQASLRPQSPGYNESMTLRLILQTGLRNGGEATEADSFGASSLRMEHVRIVGDTLTLTFPGKGGHPQEHTVTDRVLAGYIQTRRAAGAETVFPHTADDTYAYMQKVTRGKFKVHDLRTWYGSIYADRLVQEAGVAGLLPKTTKEYKAFRKAIGTKVSEALGNTPAIALKSYVHPAILKGVEP